MLNVLQRRAPGLQVLINPVRVQGTGAAAEIAVAIRELTRPNDSWTPLDLVVITRGGGSIEDLWEFNEEIVARAIFDSPIPIVSAVGHEIDFTISDFVADLRAPTPSAAAELIVADVTDVLRRVGELSACLDRNLRNFISQTRTRLRFLSEKSLARDLVQRVRDAQQQIDLARESLTRLVRQSVADNRARVASHAQTVQAHSPARELIARRDSVEQLRRRLVVLPSRTVGNARQRFARLEAMARLLGPEATLRRGYSITTDETGAIVRATEAVRPDQTVTTRVVDGTFESKVLP
jgi:exodeoxyribonuclease VII large subunit